MRFLPVAWSGWSSIRHQCWHGHGFKHAARDTAQDTLIQAGMAVAAHDDQIEAAVGCNRQDGRLDFGAASLHTLNSCGEAAPRQLGR